MTNISVKKFFIIITLLGSVCFAGNQAAAAGLKDAFNTDSSSSELKRFSLFANYDTTQAQNPEYYIGLLLKGLFSLLGIICIGLLMYSGFTWMTAQGNEDKVKKAKENIENILIGLILIIGGYALTVFLLNIFT